MKQIEVTAMTKAAAKATVLGQRITNPAVPAAIVPKSGSRRKGNEENRSVAPLLRQAIGDAGPFRNSGRNAGSQQKSTDSRLLTA